MTYNPYNSIFLVYYFNIGEPDSEIKLSLVYPKSATEYFYLDGKNLKLKQSIDRDAQDLAQVSLQVQYIKPFYSKN